MLQLQLACGYRINSSSCRAAINVCDVTVNPPSPVCLLYSILSWHFVINSRVKLTEYGVGVHDVGVYVPGVWSAQIFYNMHKDLKLAPD